MSATDSPPAGDVAGDVIAQEDWLADARRRFGADPSGWRFECVSCGNVASVAEFEALGVDGQRAPFECIGRIHLEQGATGVDGNSKPCNWHANGLITLSGLVKVSYTEGSGKTTHVFPFAQDGAA